MRKSALITVLSRVRDAMTPELRIGRERRSRRGSWMGRKKVRTGLAFFFLINTSCEASKTLVGSGRYGTYHLSRQLAAVRVSSVLKDGNRLSPSPPGDRPCHVRRSRPYRCCLRQAAHFILQKYLYRYLLLLLHSNLIHSLYILLFIVPPPSCLYGSLLPPYPGCRRGGENQQTRNPAPHPSPATLVARPPPPGHPIQRTKRQTPFQT